MQTKNGQRTGNTLPIKTKFFGMAKIGKFLNVTNVLSIIGIVTTVAVGDTTKVEYAIGKYITVSSVCFTIAALLSIFLIYRIIYQIVKERRERKEQEIDEKIKAVVMAAFNILDDKTNDMEVRNGAFFTAIWHKFDEIEKRIIEIEQIVKK